MFLYLFFIPQADFDESDSEDFEDEYGYAQCKPRHTFILQLYINL